MVDIIGQKTLLKTLDSYTIQTLPKTMLFLGEAGCGKRIVARHLADRLGLDFVIIENNTTSDQLIEFAQKPLKTIYFIDLSAFTEKAQNQFLKFVEEPADSVYVIMAAKSEIGILPTILSRGIKHHFEAYSEEQLKQFEWMVSKPNALVYKICRTPGQLADIDGDRLVELYKLCKNIAKNIKKASYANTLSIALKINFREDYSKFDFETFFNVLEYAAFEEYKETNTKESFITYQLTNKYRQQLSNRSVAKESFTLNFLSTLWEAVR